MARLSNKKKKEIAESMFINEGMSGKAIAGSLDVTENTISRWRHNDTPSWDDRRLLIMSSPYKIKEVLIEELSNIASGKEAKINADALSKIAKVIDTISGKISVQLVVSIFKEFDNWMSEQEPEMAIKFTQWHKQFILYKAALDS